MSRRAHTSLLLPLVALACGLVNGGHALAEEEKPTAEAPIRAITLYRSGVGYFEHHGRVKGDTTIALRFDADRVNDILKSMVVLDEKRGVRGVSYASKEPLMRRLASFGINLGDNPSIAEIMRRLRGTSVRVTTPDHQIEGTILGTETRASVVGGTRDAGGTAINEPFVTLLTAQGVRAVSISQIATFEIRDAHLAAELGQALGALDAARAERTATVEIAFGGDEERTVGIAYVHESPVWKTSYRLLLPDAADQPLQIQGWAIVENTTDQDWTDVRLALAAGNPIGFVMDLHTPLFLDRPVVPVPVMGFVRSRQYDSVPAPRPAGTAAPAPAERGRGAGVGMRSRALDRVGQSLEAPGAPVADAAPESSDWDGAAPEAQASGAQVGEQFRYEVRDPVTIARQRSAMLPLLTGAISGERVSIYNQFDLREHPMRGVDLRNMTGLDLAPGPISVFDSGAYAGDAQIGFTSRGQSRLLSYAVDLDVRALVEPTETQSLERIRIASGLLVQEFRSRSKTEYRFVNRDGRRPRTILVEHPKRGGWTVVAPTEAPASESETLRRYRVALASGAEAVFAVVEERTHMTRHAVRDTAPDALLQFAQSGQASAAVRALIENAAGLQRTVNDLEERKRRLEAERREIFEDQQRIRANMGSVDRRGELYTRYVQRLAEQETRLGALLQEQETTLAQLVEATRARDQFFATASAD